MSPASVNEHGLKLFSDIYVLQDFLKSEVSDENILFWQACEKFQKIPPNNLDEVGMISYKSHSLLT